MSDPLTRMIAREGGGGHKRSRRGPPPARPPFVCHPCSTWTDEHIEKHLRACQTGRDPVTGAWNIDTDDPAECWAWLWECGIGKRQPDGSIDFGPWPVRSIEVP